MSSHKLDEHIASDEKTHSELKTQLKELFKVIRKWALVGGVMGGILGHAIHALEGCNAAIPGRPTALDLATYQNDQVACVTTYVSKADIDSCRAANRSEWCGRFPGEVNCAKDGGRE